MKKLLLTVTAFSILNLSFGTIHTVINTLNTGFSPALVMAVSGDTIQYNLAAGHTATSVSQTTWLANGSAPTTGDFNILAPTGQYFIPAVFTGVIYYVCVNHVGLTGMKGIINVGPSSLSEIEPIWTLNAFPNPADNFINLKAEGVNGKMSIRVIDVLGADVLPSVTVEATSCRLNVIALSQGTYFIRIENGDRTKVIRFMKK